MSKSVSLLTPEQIKSEIPLFKLWGFSDSKIETIANLPHHPDAIKGINMFIDHFNMWDDVDGLTFCLVPFKLIYKTFLEGGFKEVNAAEEIEGMFSVLADGTPVMFLDIETFTPSVFRHELIHYKQYQRGDSTREGYKFYWKGTEKPGFFDQSRSLAEQCEFEWELEAYALMYTDEELYQEHQAGMEAIANDTHHEIVNRMRDYYRLVIGPYGRELPFKVML